MRRPLAAALLMFFATVGMACGMLSASAAPSADPTPEATGSSQVSFTVADPESPSPGPSSSTGGGSSSAGGSGGGSGGTGSGSGDGTTTPACVPSATEPAMASRPAGSPAGLRLSTRQTAQGSEITVSGDGFQAGERATVAIYPNATKLATTTIRTSGQAFAVVKIPKRTQLGSHTIQVIGWQDCHADAGTISVVSPPGSGSSVFPWVVWAVTGGCVGLAGVALLIALALGWLPKVFALGVAGAVR